MDQLWVPILTHYEARRVNARRILDHIGAISSDVRSVLLAGSTGDGWELADDAFADLLSVLADPTVFSPKINFMVGILRPKEKP